MFPTAPFLTLWDFFLFHLSFKDILFFLLLVLTCQYLIHRLFSHGPFPWPIVGMLPHLLINSTRIYDWYTETQIQLGGSFRFVGPWLSHMHGIITSDPRNVEYILKTNFHNFPKGQRLQSILHDVLGDGIFNADHELWMMQRKVASLEFSNRTFKEYMAKTIQELVDDRLIPVLNDASKRGSPIDLQNVLLRYTFDSTCIGAFGVNSGWLALGLPEVPFAKAFDTAIEAAIFRFIVPESWWRSMRALNVGTERQIKEALTVVDHFAAHVISSRRKEIMLERENGTRQADILTSFMQLRDATGAPYSNKFLRDLAVNFIIAGRDTSAVALAWFFWQLEQHPDVELNILREVEEIVKRRTKEERSFTRNELNEMHYLHAAISESLRLYPSVPLDTKQVMQADVLPDGREVRAGDRLTYSIYSMGRMESIWGKDCLEFKPERWLVNGRFVSQSVFKFVAFNGGPRLCLGKEIAYLQMKAAAAAIIQMFHVKVVEGHPVAMKFSATLYMKHGLLVTLHSRTQGSPVGDQA